MVAGECSYEEWGQAVEALRNVEDRLCAAWEAEHGEPKRGKDGHILGGKHPALNPALYEEALRNKERETQQRKAATGETI